MAMSYGPFVNLKGFYEFTRIFKFEIPSLFVKSNLIIYVIQC